MLKKLIVLSSLSLCALVSRAQFSSQETFQVEKSNVVEGYFTQKIWLQSYQYPDVSIAREFFEKTAAPVNKELIKKEKGVQITLGMERKRPFAWISIPVYKEENGEFSMLKTVTVEVKEKPATASAANYTADYSSNNTQRTTSTSSVLATGSWGKIAVAQRGIYKVDYDFVRSKLGAGNTISSAQIRLFGNGGTMLYEDNKVARYDDLKENAIEMHDGGDGVFNSGDYFLFYANGPLEWVKDSAKQIFTHRTHLYADSSYYFLTYNNGDGLRIANSSFSGTPNIDVNTYNDYALHETDRSNMGRFGKIWWGESFGNDASTTPSRTFTFNVDNVVDSIYYSYQLGASVIGANGFFAVKFNGSSIRSHLLTGISGEPDQNPGSAVAAAGYVSFSGASPAFQFDFSSATTSGKGFLDYLEINMRRQMAFKSGSQMNFRDWRSVAPGNIARYNLTSANANTRVWDITNPLEPASINGNLSGSIYTFSQAASSLHEFIAFDGSYLTPSFSGKIDNQDLHGLGQTDYIIVARDDMMDAAKKLADFHVQQNNLKVAVVSVNQVYNEFSSGAQDISAIRDFAKMFYDRAGSDTTKMPRYLLLMGQASYDYRNRVVKNIKTVPTYETPESINATLGFCSDDFFGFLDDNENIDDYTISNTLDIGVGRIPAVSGAEANDVVDKILRYKSSKSLGPWRINNTYAGDVEDGAGPHLSDAEEMSESMLTSNNAYNSTKVYLNNMLIVSTPGGARCPDANKAINDGIYKGTFLFNYSGHGSIYTLSAKRILTQDDFKAWKNEYKLPIMITATCDFSRFDDPSAQSAGEKLILKSDGGAIALLTTTQVVYQNGNNVMNKAYLQYQFTKGSDRWSVAFGDGFRKGKNSIIGRADVSNTRKFVLLGDPALTPNIPRYAITTDSVKQLIDGSGYASDTIKSLGTYTVSGSIRDDNGNVLEDFNGKLNVTFYDKPQTVNVVTYWGAKSYKNLTNIIYKGNATVVNGHFSFSFIAPKDINYNYGKGKISYYAENGVTDATGSDTSITIGGFSEHFIADNDGPVVKPYMNDSLFVDGGLTGTNSVLFVKLADESGINVSGNGVGHDLTAVLDNQYEVPYILNDYYETAPNTYKLGYVNFPISGLTEGVHTLTVKAWDVFNNSGEGTVTFRVADGKVMVVEQLYTYPNPFTDLTHFVFEHNHPNEKLDVTVYIYNIAGTLVRTINQTFTPAGSKTAEITWDGTGNGGEPLQSGIYPFRIRVATETGVDDLGTQKVSIIRN